MNRMAFYALAVLACLISQNGWAAEIPEAKPEDVSMSSAKLAEIDVAVQKLIQSEKMPGAVVLVARAGKIVYFKSQGQISKDNTSKMEKDSVLAFFSMTKPVTSVAVMMLVEQGKIKLEDPVEEYLPELKNLMVYGKDGKLEKAQRKMTILDLLRHTSGLSYGMFGDSPVDKMYVSAGMRMDSTQATIEQLAEIPLKHQPGAAWEYSVSTDVLGFVVQKVSGKKLSEFFEENIFKPLDMRKSKLAFPSGGGGMLSNARDYLRFCEMLLNKGQLDGKRLLKPETVEMMMKDQLPAGVRCNHVFGFGLGFMIELTDLNFMGITWRQGQASWDGIAGTHFWISPKDDLVVVALSQVQPFTFQLKEAIRGIISDSITGRAPDRIETTIPPE